MEYAQLYRAGKKRLYDAGVEEAELDARLLLEFVCGSDRSVLYAHPERQVSEAEQEKYEAFLAKRSKRVPLAHITGMQSFMGLDFLVNENVLIPRQDTEILVEEVLKEPYDGSRILDICSGSGCILLSLLHYSNHSSGIGLELSEKAIEVAAGNSEKLGLTERAQFIKSDLLEKAEGYFDIVVSNPPYIRTSVIETLMPEVRDYEPFMALDGRESGLFFYESILSDIGEYMKNGSRMYFEIGFDQGNEVKALMESAGFAGVEVIQDYGGNDRVVKGYYRSL